MLYACSGHTDDFWAIESLWFERQEESAHGFQIWQIYDSQWATTRAATNFECSVIIPWTGSAEPPCTHCQESWVLLHDDLISDCEEAVLTGWDWTHLTHLGLSAASTLEWAPPDTEPLGIWAKWKNQSEWVQHGWALEGENNRFNVETPWVWQLNVEN